MERIEALVDRLIAMSGSSEAAAARLGVSHASVLRWRGGKSTPQPAQQRKLRYLVESFKPMQDGLPSPGISRGDIQIENILRSILTDFRETIHRHGRFSHRNDSLDFLSKLLLAHILDKRAGGRGLSSALIDSGMGPARSLKEFVERQLQAALPASLSFELSELGKSLSISSLDGDLARQVVEIFARPVVDEVLGSLVQTSGFDVLNDIFGRFVTDSFVEEKEMGQYLTPPSVVNLMADLGARSLSAGLLDDILNGGNERFILDPSCGVGSFLVAGVRSVLARAEGQGNPEQVRKNVVGVDKSGRMAQLAITNLALLGSSKTNVVLSNALDRRPGSHLPDMAGKAALILTNPPFGASFSSDEVGDYALFGIAQRARIDSELLFLERYLEWLCPGGVLVAIIPDSVLTNQGAFARIRSLLATDCSILSVISLPQVTFAAAGTSTKTSILHVRKHADASRREPVEATYFARCEHVGYEVSTRGSLRRRVFVDRNDLPRIAEEAAREVEPVIGALVPFDGKTDRWDARFNIAGARSGQHGLDTVPLRDLADLVADKANPLRFSEETFEYIEISNVDDRMGMVWSKQTLCVEAPGRARKRVRAGDVLISTVRPERGCIGVVPPHLDGAICSTGFAVLRSKLLDPFALVFLLKSRHFLDQIEQHMRGIAYPAINENLLPAMTLLKAQVSNRDLEEAAKRYARLSEKIAAEYRALSGLVA